MKRLAICLFAVLFANSAAVGQQTSIPAFPTAPSINASDLWVVTQVNPLSPSGYTTRKAFLNFADPWVSPSGYGQAMIFGPNAGLNWQPSAIETTITGNWAGGSNGCGSNFGGGLTCEPPNLGGGTGLTAAEDSFYGWGSGTQETTGQYLSAFGVGTLEHDYSGLFDVAIGVDAMRNCNGMAYDIGIGPNALRNVSGNYNLAIGQNALSNYNNSGSPTGDGVCSAAFNNLAIGFGAIGGQESAHQLGTFSGNTIVGHNGEQNLATGPNNHSQSGRAGILQSTAVER